tara:strand:- start:512 stop:1186 length:675 start_codon:yes stop_codon:yes gene_type:complete
MGFMDKEHQRKRTEKLLAKKKEAESTKKFRKDATTKDTETPTGNIGKVQKITSDTQQGGMQKTKAASASKAPIVTKKQLEDSGFTNLRDYMNNQKGLTRRDNASVIKKETSPGNIASRTDNSDSSKMGPDLSKVTKTDTKKDMPTMDRIKDVIGIGRPATEREQMGRDLQDNARKSMGMKKGGKVHKMPNGSMMKGAKHGMKHGGAVKAKSIDGIAVRGKTRCK